MADPGPLFAVGSSVGSLPSRVGFELQDLARQEQLDLTFHSHHQSTLAGCSFFFFLGGSLDCCLLPLTIPPVSLFFFFLFSSSSSLATSPSPFATDLLPRSLACVSEAESILSLCAHFTNIAPEPNTHTRTRLLDKLESFLPSVDFSVITLASPAFETRSLGASTTDGTLHQADNTSALPPHTDPAFAPSL